MTSLQGLALKRDRSHPGLPGFQSQAPAVRGKSLSLCKDKYGLDVVQSSIEALLDYGERMTRLELAKLPKGIYEAEDWIDDDGIGNGPFPVRVKITITDDEFICDFTGTHPQVPGPVNCALTGLHSGVRTMVKASTSPSIPANEECSRHLKSHSP